MPSIDKTFLLSLHDEYTKYTCFIETGTFYGDTIFSIEPYFNNIYTIEYSEILYKKTKILTWSKKTTEGEGKKGLILHLIIFIKLLYISKITYMHTLV